MEGRGRERPPYEIELKITDRVDRPEEQHEDIGIGDPRTPFAEQMHAKNGTLQAKSQTRATIKTRQEPIQG